jgi:hypothetical protein
MNEQKELYLDRIRSQSAYPWIRRLAVVVLLAFFSSAIFILVLALAFFGKLGLLVLPISIILFIAGAVLREASIMLADIADSVTDLNCRYEQ